MTEENLETKQLYLREEIIDKGYDPSDFNIYMCNIRQEENIDLNNWTIEELKNVVSNYIESKVSQSQEQKEEVENDNQYEVEKDNKNEVENGNQNEVEKDKEKDNQNEVENDNQKNINNNDETINNNKKDSQVSSIEKITNNPFDNFLKKGYCTKLEKNEFTDLENLRVKISDPIRINPGFFSISYFQYKVTTLPLNYSVIRKLSDFLFLNDKLPLIHPVKYTPLFPTFHYGVKDDSPKKLRYIQNYMDSLLENKYFRSLPLVNDFLTLSLNDWEQKIKNTYSKITEAKGFETMPNLEGIYFIKISKEEEDKASLIKNELNTKNEALKNLNYYLDELISYFDKISQTLKNISTCFYNMEKTEINLKRNDILIKGYNNLGNLFKIWGDDYLQQKDFIRDEIKYYFKFISKEYKYFFKNFDDYKSARDEYKKSFDKFKKNKNPSTDDFEMLKDIQKYYGYELTCINEEYKNLEERMEKRLINQFTCYYEKKDIFFKDLKNCIELVNFNNDKNNINNIENNNNIVSEVRGNNEINKVENNYIEDEINNGNNN